MEGCGTLGRWASGSSAGVAKRSAARSKAAGSTRRGSGKAPRSPGPITPRPTSMSRRLSKKALNEGDEAQGSLPDSQGGAVVRGRSPFGFEADRAQGMESHRSKTAREGPPALRVDLPLRLRAPQERRGPLAHLAHRERRGVLDGFGALR